jgi:hypothetical protein
MTTLEMAVANDPARYRYSSIAGLSINSLVTIMPISVLRSVPRYTFLGCARGALTALKIRIDPAACC